MTKYFTLLAQITYPGPAGHNKLSRTCTIPNFECEYPQDDPEDGDCIWEQTLTELFFKQLKRKEMDNLLKSCHKGHIGLKETGLQLQNLYRCDDLVELYRIRFKATNIVITILEHRIDTTNKHSVPETECLLEEYHHNL